MEKTKKELKKENVIAFFDEHAAGWDAELIRDDAVIRKILDNAGVKEGSRVLDVATGTGVLIPDYLARKAGTVTAIDISPKMIAIARKKYQAPSQSNGKKNESVSGTESFAEDRAYAGDCKIQKERFSGEKEEHTIPENRETELEFICGDVEETEVGKDFDAIVVYNAFPHFPEPERLIRRLAGLLRTGGTLTIAHGMGRARIDAHHEGRASHVSNGLPEAEKVAELFAKYLDVTCIIDEENIYQVCGRKGK